MNIAIGIDHIAPYPSTSARLEGHLRPDAPCVRRRSRPWLGQVLALVALFGLACGHPQEQVASEVAEPGELAADHTSPTTSSVTHPELAIPRDAAHVGDHWFVLDLGANEVHRFDADGRLVASFGGEGEGPGELATPRSIAGHGDTVAVLDGSTVELFSASGSFIGSRPVLVPGCEGSLVGVESLVSLSIGLATKAECIKGRQARTLVVRETDTGLWRVVVSSEARDVGIAAMAGAVAVLTDHPDGLVFGSADDPCLIIYSEEGVPLREECHDALVRHPLPEKALAKMESVGARALSLGIDLELPKTLPPFHRVFGQEQGLVYQSIDPMSEDLDSPYYRLVSQDAAGNQVPLPVPPARGFFMSGTSALALWDAVEGTRVAVFDLAGD